MALLRLIESLKAPQWEHCVVALGSEGALSERVRAAGARVVHLDMNPALPTIRPLIKLRHVMRLEQPDLVQGWMYHGNLIAWLARRLAGNGCPLVWAIRHSNTSREKWLTRRVIQAGARLSPCVDATVYVARAAIPHHRSLGYGGHDLAIPNGFDLNMFKPDQASRASVRRELGLSDSAKLVGILGRYHPMKDHASFLQAAKKVLDVMPDVHFLMAGRGLDRSDPELREKLNALALGKHVHLLGERHDGSRLMASLDAYASSSYGEAFPQVLGEAMASGVPCVATDVGDSGYILGDLGHCVPPRDADSLAAALVDTLNMPAERRHEVATAWRRRIEEKFSLAAIADEYAELYAGLVSEERHLPEANLTNTN